MSLQLITHNKRDVEIIIDMVIARLRKTEFIHQTSINPEDDRLSQKEAANFLKISVTSIISWKKKGIIPYYSIGNRIFYSKSELLIVARKNRHLVTPSRK